MKRPVLVNIGRPLRIAFLIVAVGSALALSGCGDETTQDPTTGGDGSGVSDPASGGDGPDPGGEPAGTDNPCEMLTREEIAAVTGSPVGAGERTTVQCIWPPEVRDGTQAQVALSYVPIASFADPDEVCRNMLLGTPDATPFSGAALGNSTHWSYKTGSRIVGGGIGSLFVCLDSAFMMTQVISERTERELQQMAVALATTALGRV